MPSHYIAWWNLENLFDHEDAERSDKLARTLGSELRGWTQSVLDTKLEQLATIIKAMNGGEGPDILGVCEVESKAVLKKLVALLRIPGRRYSVRHEDTKDGRGIDVAFVFDTRRYRADKTFSHFILKRTASRDLFQVNFDVKDSGRPLIVVGNHWPSRMGGELESEPYRILAAETLAYWNERIHAIVGDDAPLVVMGDFNDEPHSRSLTDYALSSNSVTKVKRARSPRLFNLMWPALGRGEGTHYYGSEYAMLDQFLVSRGLLSQPWTVDDGSVQILTEHMAKSSGAPHRFSRPSKRDYDATGFSDHFPIAMRLVES